MERIGDRGALEAFVRSVELGGFSAAARELKLSPSALSKLVGRLERTLCVRLLHRTTRKLTPTAEGELFLARCRRILGEFEDAENEIGRTRDRPRGRLRMHVGAGFAVHQLVPALPRFTGRCPEVQLDILVEDRNADLVKEDIDLSVRPGPLQDTSLVARTLFEFERIVCASPGYLSGNGTPRTPEDLAQHRCLVVSGFPGRGTWSFRTPRGARSLEVVPFLKINNADAMLRLAIAGAGIVRLNEFIVADALHRGQLVPVLQDYHVTAAEPMFALFPHQRHRLPRVAAMLDFLRDEFGARPWRATPG